MARILENWNLVITKSVSVTGHYINFFPSVQAWRWILLILSPLRECCISFPMTSYKRCDRLPNCEADFTKRFYPIYYNVIPYFLGVNVSKAKNAISGRKFPKLMAR